MIRNVMKAIDKLLWRYLWKRIFMKRHKHSSWIFFNSVQQLDSGRTRQAWQMSLQPMVQLYKRDVSGESGEENNLHFGDHWSIKSSFCGFLTQPSEADVEIRLSWNKYKYSASHWEDIYHTAYNCEIFLFPLLIIVATYIRIYTLLSRCRENNFLS